MDEKTFTQQSAMVPPEETVTQQTPGAPGGQAIPETTEIAAHEQRKAYGTAKTENLRDSELWRYLLPAAVILGCLALLAIPLIILIPLFAISLDPAAATHSLAWLWITMILLEIGAAAIIIYGLTKIFLTQAGNYHR